MIRHVGAGNDGRTVLVLERPAWVRDIPDYNKRRLDGFPREFVRQAALLAAHDELGLATRDQVIDDTPTTESVPPDHQESIEIVSWIHDTLAHSMMRRIDQGKVETLVTQDTPVRSDRTLNLKLLLETAERLSREAFPKALTKLGVAGKPHAIKPDAPLPERVEGQLAGLGFPETLAVTRELHEAIRTDGESPIRLGALVRAYAQLGVLSEFQWSGAHRAYKARSLLYAKRLLTRDPESPWGYWHRASPGPSRDDTPMSLADLDLARQKAGMKGAPAAPAWVVLLTASARCDAEALARLAEGTSAYVRLGALLRMAAWSSLVRRRWPCSPRATLSIWPPIVTAPTTRPATITVCRLSI